MRTAKDGKLFDVDNLSDLREDEVEVIQYLRPNGKRRRMAAPVGKEIAKLAQDQILSCEELRTGEVAIYSRLIGESEENELIEIAENGPGEKSPSKMLIKVIKEKAKVT